MEPLDQARCLRILEVPATASLEEIRQAYQLLKRIHGKPLEAFSAPGMDEFALDLRLDLLEELEAAFRFLCERHPEPAREPAPEPARAAPPPRPAGSLRLAREAAGLDLEQVAQATRVRRELLKALEEGRFDDLHLAPVVVRGYLTAHLNAIGLTEGAAQAAHLEPFLHWQSQRAGGGR